MPLNEKRERLAGLKDTIEQLDVHHWATKFMDSMRQEA
jgi:trehalose-6-phosphate synthase